MWLSLKMGGVMLLAVPLGPPRACSGYFTPSHRIFSWQRLSVRKATVYCAVAPSTPITSTRSPIATSHPRSP